MRTAAFATTLLACALTALPNAASATPVQQQNQLEERQFLS